MLKSNKEKSELKIIIPQGQLKTELVRFKPCCGKCSQIQHATIQASTKNQNLGGVLVNSVVYFKITQQDPLDSSDFFFYLWKSHVSCVILWEAG